MRPIIQSPRERQIVLGSGVRVQSAGTAGGGGVQSAYSVGFDGNNDYIAVPSTPLSDAPCTICAWVKPTTPAGLNRVVTIINNAYSRGLLLYIESSIVYALYAGTASNLASISGVQAGQWQHIAAVFSSKSNAVAYLNGVAGTAATTDGVGMPTLDKIEIATLGTLASQWFRGNIDDLRIYNRALSAAEVASIYANIASPPTSGLVAYWPLDEGTGTTTTDTIGSLVGTLTNGPTWETDVPTPLA